MRYLLSLAVALLCAPIASSNDTFILSDDQPIVLDNSYYDVNVFWEYGWLNGEIVVIQHIVVQHHQ